MTEVYINCENKTKDKINKDTVHESKGKKEIHLYISNYKYDTFEDIVFPDATFKLDCYNNGITSCSAAFGSPG
jgi:hypothetical protein